MQPDEATILAAQAHVVSLLNELENVVTGWVLQWDREWVSQQIDPIYARLDTDNSEWVGK